MTNITFKCKKNICKKIHSFHHYLTWYLASIFVLTPRATPSDKSAQIEINFATREKFLQS